MNKRTPILLMLCLLMLVAGMAQYNLSDTAEILDLYKNGELIENQNPEAALGFYSKGLKASQQLNYERGMFLYYRDALYLLTNLGEFRKADSLKAEFLALAARSDNDYYKAIANEGAGTFYARQDINDRAITHYVKAALLFDKIKDSNNLNLTYRNASIVFLALDQPENAVYYLTRAVELRPFEKDTFSMIQSLSILGESYGKMKDSMQEKNSLQKMVSLSANFGNDYLKVKSFAKYGEYLYSHHQLDSCRIYLERARELAEKNGFELELFHILVDLLELNNNNKKSSTASTIESIDKLLNSGSTSFPLTTERYYLATLSEVLKDQGKYKEALKIKERWVEVNDSINNRMTRSKLAYFDKQLKQTEDRNVMLEQQYKIKSQRSIISILILGMASLVLLTLMIAFAQKKKNQLREQTIESMRKEQKFIAVKSSLEAQIKERVRISKEIHDELGSSLTSISLLTEVLKKRVNISDFPEVVKISERSAEMVDRMNEIVWAMSTTNDNLQSLLAYTRKFANTFLQEAGMEFVYTEVGAIEEQPIDGYARRNIYLVIKEALNNVVKHSGATRVILAVQCSDQLIISVKDNGRGFDPNKDVFFRNGIINMKKRMEELGGELKIVQENGAEINLFYSFKVATGNT